MYEIAPAASQQTLVYGVTCSIIERKVSGLSNIYIMSLLVLDKFVERRLRAQRKAWGVDQHDEVWEGVYVMSPIADDEHQSLVMGLSNAFYEVIERPGLGKVRPGINVSDRVERWTKNYRTPDVIVVLDSSGAENHGKFWTGPLDFVVEIVSRGDRSRRKLPFYSKIGVRELLLVDRKPWRLVLYRHDGEKLMLTGSCESVEAMPLECNVLPFTFRLVAAEERPRIELRHKTDGRTWLA
jgi:Uma2 family endonuclease